MDSVHSSGSRTAASTKIVIAGGFGVGKTTLVGLGLRDRAAAHRGPGHQRVRGRRRPRASTPASRPPRWPWTSAASRWPRTSCSTCSVRPGQKRFWFMWDDLVPRRDRRDRAWSTPPVSTPPSRRWTTSSPRDVPFIVAVNEFEGGQKYPLHEIAEALALPDDVPLITARRPRPRLGQAGPGPDHRVRAHPAGHAAARRRHLTDASRPAVGGGSVVSPGSVGGRGGPRSVPSANSRRSTFLSNLPTEVRGTWSMNAQASGSCHFANDAPRWSRRSLGRRRGALAQRRRSPAGAPATSRRGSRRPRPRRRRGGPSARSRGRPSEIHSPPDLITSLARSVSVM